MCMCACTKDAHPPRATKGSLKKRSRFRPQRSGHLLSVVCCPAGGHFGHFGRGRGAIGMPDASSPKPKGSRVSRFLSRKSSSSSPSSVAPGKSEASGAGDSSRSREGSTPRRGGRAPCCSAGPRAHRPTRSRRAVVFSSDLNSPPSCPPPAVHVPGSPAPSRSSLDGYRNAWVSDEVIELREQNRQLRAEQAELELRESSMREEMARLHHLDVSRSPCLRRRTTCARTRGQDLPPGEQSWVAGTRRRKPPPAAAGGRHDATTGQLL